MNVTRFPSAASEQPLARRLRGDEGTALVEFALVLPILIWLGVAMIEYGFAWRQEDLVESALLNAARTDAQQSKGRFADFEALQALGSSLSGLKRTSVDKIIIWNATSQTNNTPPTVCVNKTVSTNSAVGDPTAQCSVYSAQQMNTSQPVGFPAGASTSPSCPTGSWDINWCPTTRTNTEGNGDWVGMWVQVSYTSFSGLIPNHLITMKKAAVYRLEPPYIGS
jgi:Flp pilus assembly protein TadG